MELSYFHQIQVFVIILQGLAQHRLSLHTAHRDGALPPKTMNPAVEPLSLPTWRCHQHNLVSTTVVSLLNGWIAALSYATFARRR